MTLAISTKPRSIDAKNVVVHAGLGAAGDTALILHTSGSTGRPKRVPLTHAQLSISAANVAGPDTRPGAEA